MDASPSCLFYLFANRLISKERHWHLAMGEIAVPVPGSNTLVALGHLEQLLLAVAIWHLAATGAVTLDRDMALGRSPFRLEPRTANGNRPGLEGQLLVALPVGGASLRDVVMRRWAAEHPMALNAIVVEAQTEALTLGLIDRPDTPNLAPGLFGNGRFFDARPSLFTRSWTALP